MSESSARVFFRQVCVFVRRDSDPVVFLPMAFLAVEAADSSRAANRANSDATTRIRETPYVSRQADRADSGQTLRCLLK